MTMALKDLVPWKKKDQSLMVRRHGTPLDAWHAEMDRLFDRALSTWPMGFDFSDRRMRGFFPDVDVAETDKEVKVTMELPGIDEKDLDVTIDQTGLTIRGEKREKREEDKSDYYFSERSYGSFHRHIPLPDNLIHDKAEAKFKKGVLKISIPKSPETSSKRKALTIRVE